MLGDQLGQAGRDRRQPALERQVGLGGDHAAAAGGEQAASALDDSEAGRGGAGVYAEDDSAAVSRTARAG